MLVFGGKKANARTERQRVMEKINVLHLIKTLNMGGAEKNLYNLVG